MGENNRHGMKREETISELMSLVSSAISSHFLNHFLGDTHVTLIDVETVLIVNIVTLALQRAREWHDASDACSTTG